jgi:hypothetical protein
MKSTLNVLITAGVLVLLGGCNQAALMLFGGPGVECTGSVNYLTGGTVTCTNKYVLAQRACIRIAVSNLQTHDGTISNDVCTGDIAPQSTVTLNNIVFLRKSLLDVCHKDDVHFGRLPSFDDCRITLFDVTTGTPKAL